MTITIRWQTQRRANLPASVACRIEATVQGGGRDADRTRATNGRAAVQIRDNRKRRETDTEGAGDEMLACGHDREPFGAPMCVHLRVCREPWISYLKWYTGAGKDTELLCKACVEERQNGRQITTAVVCQECFQYATTEVGDIGGVRGRPEIRIRSVPINPQLQRSAIPKGAGRIIDISPFITEGRSTWLLLADDGLITQFDADTDEWKCLVCARLTSEPDHEPWCGRFLKPRLHVAPGGDFAAIVNDYGRYGQLIDLRTGRVTLALHGGDYHMETVPFSFAFAQVNGRVFAIHRTDWNRLDVSDPCTGHLLTVRSPTSYRRGEERPLHYLDYFHGALHVSPNSIRIADDGWVWHPVGIPATWSLEQWISGNVWESEDGSTRKVICARDYYWDHALTWLDDQRIAIGGIGEDDVYMVEGARIFDISLPGGPNPGCRADWPWPCELIAFAGPAGTFFSEGHALFSSDQSGLSRWDVKDGSRTGYLQGFKPTYHHRGARELVQVVDGVLVRWMIDNGEPL